MNSALAGRLRHTRQLHILEQSANHTGGFDGLLDSLPFGRIEIEDHPVRLIEVDPTRRPHVNRQHGHLGQPAERLRSVDDEMPHGFPAARARGRVNRSGPFRHLAADVLLKPRRLLDSLIPMLQRQRPVTQSADHRLGHRVVVVRHILFGDFVAGIEHSIGIA